MNRLISGFSLFLLLAGQGLAQPVKDLSQSAVSGSAGSSSGSSSGQSSGHSDFSPMDGFLLARNIWFLGQCFVLVGREQVRLARRNREENHLFGLEGEVAGGAGLKDFARFQPRIRLHLGVVSLDWRQTMLQDRSSEFNTTDVLAWFNLVNRPVFRLRTGMGNLHLALTRQNYFVYGAAAEVHPGSRLGFEAWATSTSRLINSMVRPRWEAGVRARYVIWQKGLGRASVFGGCSYQEYFRAHPFATLDGGIQMYLSFSRYATSTGRTKP